MDEPHLEIELKYAATPTALVALRVAERLGPADLGPAILNDETDRYLDTADGRLAAATWACRLRTRRVGGTASTRISLKGPAEAVDGALHRRLELEGPATDDLDPARWPASAARDLVDRLRDGEPLAEFLFLAQRRHERPVSVAGAVVGTLSLDQATVRRGGRTLGTLHVVELELASAAESDHLDALARELEQVSGLVADHRSKLEHALAMPVGAPGVVR